VTSPSTPCTTKVWPFTEPSRLVATSTTVSPGFSFMPRAMISGISTLPRSSRPFAALPCARRPASIGMAAASRSGSTPFSRIEVVSMKLLNMAPNFRRGDQATTASSPASAFSTCATAAGFMLRLSGRLSMEAT
jgi:hypothetical protein